MILTLRNGHRKEIGPHETMLVSHHPTPDINDSTTWESDRAWVFAKVGWVTWCGATRDENEWSEIVEIQH